MSSQQPVFVYPDNTVTKQPSSSHSNGSFGSVFIVLAVIVVVSAIACFLGRFCSRRYHSHMKAKQTHHGSSKPKERDTKQNHNFHGRGDTVDIEFGFDKGISIGKPIGKGQAMNGSKSGGGNIGEIRGEPRFARPAGNIGEMRGEPRFADEA